MSITSSFGWHDFLVFWDGFATKFVLSPTSNSPSSYAPNFCLFSKSKPLKFILQVRRFGFWFCCCVYLLWCFSDNSIMNFINTEPHNTDGSRDILWFFWYIILYPFSTKPFTILSNQLCTQCTWAHNLSKYGTAQYVQCLYPAQLALICHCQEAWVTTSFWQMVPTLSRDAVLIDWPHSTAYCSLANYNTHHILNTLHLQIS